MKKLILSIIIFLFLFLVFSSNVYAEPEATNPSQKSTSSYNPYCWQTHMIDQMAVCSKAHTQCVSKCTPLDSGKRIPCFNECGKTLTACYKKSTADYKVCIEAERQAQKQKKQNVPNSSAEEKPQVGVSSSDFKALARANAEYQKAQADLEQVKESKDPDYEAKKDFASEYDDAFNEDEQLKKDLDAFRADLETIHELVSKTKDLSEIEDAVESIKKGGIGSYEGFDFFTDAVKSFNDYQDSRTKGISAKDAATKAGLDNFGTSALTLVPVLKAIDLVATTPDFILEIFGVDKKNWIRKIITDGFIGKFAPSGVVEQTTNLMIEDNWSDIGNALAYGWGKVQSAEGAWDTVEESATLLAGTIGAIPVAIAQGISDVVGGGLAIGEAAYEFVSNWLTYPN